MLCNRSEFIRLALAGLGTCILGACSGRSGASSGSELVAYFLKVGKADAIILIAGDTCVMVDTGDADSAEDTAERLDDLGVTTIDTLIITHFDQDHVGGAAAVIDACDVGEVLTTYQSKSSDEIDAYEDALTRHGIEARVVDADETLERGGMTIEVLAPRQDDYESDTSNNSSLVCRVTFGQTRLLLAGDIQYERIFELVEGGTDISCDLLKVPHHGAYEEDATEALVDAASPQVAVICCSKKNPEDEEVIDVLEDKGTSCYLTREGEVVIRCDGTTIDVEQ